MSERLLSIKTPDQNVLKQIVDSVPIDPIHTNIHFMDKKENNTNLFYTRSRIRVDFEANSSSNFIDGRIKVRSGWEGRNKDQIEEDHNEINQRLITGSRPDLITCKSTDQVGFREIKDFKERILSEGYKITSIEMGLTVRNGSGYSSGDSIESFLNGDEQSIDLCISEINLRSDKMKEVVEWFESLGGIEVEQK